MPNEYGLASIVPAFVRVAFPGKRCAGTPDQVVPTYYTFVDAGDTFINVNASFASERAFIDTACALYNPPGTDPTNKDTLNALAGQIAQDFYLYKTTHFDEVFNGVVNLAPNGLIDEIIVRYSFYDVTSRQVSEPYNYELEPFCHKDPAENSCTLTADPCIYFYGPPAKCVSSVINIPLYKLCKVGGRLIYTYVRTDTA